ncbi:hypothetical protein TRVL_08528 [Trypanosoma vivax]|nr:hypothetical protein TRVL_08528 [Trypanosoma vivax]
MKCALKQCLTMHRHAKQNQPRRQATHNSPKEKCKESAAHLLECPSLRELRMQHGLETLKDGELFAGAQLASFVKELFKQEISSGPTPDEPKSEPASSHEAASLTNGHGYHPLHLCESEADGLRTARGKRKRVRLTDPSSKEICVNVPLDEARMGSGLCSMVAFGLRKQGACRETTALRAD